MAFFQSVHFFIWILLSENLKWNLREVNSREAGQKCPQDYRKTVERKKVAKCTWVDQIRSLPLKIKTGYRRETKYIW